MSKAVIVTDTAAKSDNRSDGDVAFLVPPAENAALRDQITAVLGEEELRCRLGDVALVETRERFTSKHMWEAVAVVRHDEIEAHHQAGSR